MSTFSVFDSYLYEQPFYSDSYVLNSSVHFVQSSEGQESNSLIVFEAKINGINVSCCVDTGASFVFINDTLISKLNLTGIKKTPYKVKVKLANDSIQTCSYLVTIPLMINETIYSIGALILNALPYDVLIGMNFLRKFDARILISSNQIEIESDCDPPEDIQDAFLRCRN